MVDNREKNLELNKNAVSCTRVSRVLTPFIGKVSTLSRDRLGAQEKPLWRTDPSN